MDKVLEISLKQEKIKHDQRYMKIYQILKTKDIAIDSLKSKITQYNQSVSSLHNEIQQFEVYKQQIIEEIDKKRNLFRINNQGNDIESVQEFHDEISRLNTELNSRIEEVNNFHLVVQTLEEKNLSVSVSLDQSLKKCQEYEEQISLQTQKITELEAENGSQKDQVNQLVEKISSLANDNMQNMMERSKTIEKGESFIEQVNQLQETVNKIREENSTIANESNSIKEVHMSFLMSCNHAISPEAEFDSDSDIEFVQNTILSNIKDMHESIRSYQDRHQDDQGCLKMMEKEILKIQNNIASKKYCTKGDQTQITGDDFHKMNDKIQILEQEYSQIEEENDQLREYIQESENKKAHEKTLTKNKKYVKSTTSLAYSVDDENDNNAPSHSKSIKIGKNSDRLGVDNKENSDLNSSMNSISEVTDYEGKPQGEISIKKNKIRLKSHQMNLIDPSILKNKSVEQQILIADQRRQIEDLRKSNMNYESKLTYDIKEKNKIIQNLETKLENLQALNSKLKHQERNRIGEGEDNLEHYISQLELNEVELQNNLQEALREKEYCDNYNQELLLHIKE